MGYEEDFTNALYLLIMAGVIVGFIAMVIHYVSDFMISNSINEAAFNELDNADGELATQAKHHTIKYAKKEIDIEKDFKVDFNINLANSTVKTETVYAE